MKLSKIRPCDKCNGPVGMSFQVIRTSLAMVDPQAARTVAGLAGILGGSVALAEVMSPVEDAIIIAGDKEPKLMTEMILCNDCLYGSEFAALAGLIQHRNEVTEKEEANGQS